MLDADAAFVVKSLAAAAELSKDSLLNLDKPFMVASNDLPLPT